MTISSLVQMLLARAPSGCTVRSATEVAAYAARGIEFMAPLPTAVASSSSTYRELYGLAAFILAIAPLLRGGRFRAFLDNLGCVFILGGIVPEAAVGGKRLGEFVSGGSANPGLQALALQLLQAQIDGGFELQAVWLPRELNTRADYLSRVSAMHHHDYSLRAEYFRRLDAAWGPHTIDRFASIDNRQPLAAPHTGRFCAHYFHPDAEWVDAFAVSWHSELNWLFPPATASAIGRTAAHLLACKAQGTLVVPLAPWSPWASLLRPRGAWAPFVLEARPLGPPSTCLRLSRRYGHLFRGCAIYALRFDGRHGAAASAHPESLP